MKNLDPELYRKIQDAHELTNDALNYAYTTEVKTPWIVRLYLGRAQNILIKMVVGYAKSLEEETK